MLVSCERNDGSHPGDTAPPAEKQGMISTGEPGKGEPETPPDEAAGNGDDPVLVEKKAPVAEPAPGQPGKVISPFNGQLIDVAGLEPGSLVADPTYPPEAKKHFRVPDTNAEPAIKPPSTILDPSILIRPKTAPPKESEGEL